MVATQQHTSRLPAVRRVTRRWASSCCCSLVVNDRRVLPPRAGHDGARAAQDSGGTLVLLNLRERTIAQELQSVGYKTAMVGKWHMGLQTWAHHPRFRGFDRFYGYFSPQVQYYRCKLSQHILRINRTVIAINRSDTRIMDRSSCSAPPKRTKQQRC